MDRLAGSIDVRHEGTQMNRAVGRFGRVTDWDLPEERILNNCGPGSGRNRGLSGDRGNHSRNTQEVDGASQVVRESGETKLPADVL